MCKKNIDSKETLRRSAMLKNKIERLRRNEKYRFRIGEKMVEPEFSRLDFSQIWLRRNFVFADFHR
mgnify:CR=1 FL=1